MNTQDNKNSLGGFIRARRLELDLTQEQVRELVGFKSRATVSDIENGLRNPGLSHLPKLADALQVAVADLTALDTREPVRETQHLVREHPHLANVFRKVIHQSKRMSADEIARTIDAAFHPEQRAPGSADDAS